ncbi:MAG: hypothetical protein ETSY2_38600 [Candidatus Entotheonella gemina]|uniref:Uncharacterized protein n=1 Tax=Candidatus Entotheonella gemina TaxID=1429439 RepID=W4LS27_9BACT|nr:MAG: hypothetical protein ETSY2_38600 [Candidatus Entotheonella gemina]
MEHDRLNLRRRERNDQRPTRRHLSAIQQRMLIWLQDELQRRTDTTDGIPFPALVQAMRTDKLNVMTSLRQLMRKGLVAVTLPRGAWTRYIDLTSQGMAQAQDLTKQTPHTELPEKRRRPDKRERDLRKRDRRSRHRD